MSLQHFEAKWRHNNVTSKGEQNKLCLYSKQGCYFYNRQPFKALLYKFLNTCLGFMFSIAALAGALYEGKWKCFPFISQHFTFLRNTCRWPPSGRLLLLSDGPDRICVAKWHFLEIRETNRKWWLLHQPAKWKKCCFF